MYVCDHQPYLCDKIVVAACHSNIKPAPNLSVAVVGLFTGHTQSAVHRRGLCLLCCLSVGAGTEEAFCLTECLQSVSVRLYGGGHCNCFSGHELLLDLLYRGGKTSLVSYICYVVP